jgi:hypothetical protein
VDQSSNSHLLNTHRYQFDELGDSVEAPTHARQWDPDTTTRMLEFRPARGFTAYIHVAWALETVRPDHMNLYRVARTRIPPWRDAHYQYVTVTKAGLPQGC